MALRLIEIYHQRGKSEEIDFLLQDSPLLDIWHDQLPEGETITKVLLRVESTEGVLDLLQDFFIKEDLRVVILPVEATLPRPEEPSKEEEKGNEKTPQRISIEELYQKMCDFKAEPVDRCMLYVLRCSVYYRQAWFCFSRSVRRTLPVRSWTALGLRSILTISN